MNYFVYKGVKSSDMGLKIESKEVFSAPEYEVDFLSIPGRHGDLISGDGRFPNAQVTYSVFLPGWWKTSPPVMWSRIPIPGAAVTMPVHSVPTAVSAMKAQWKAAAIIKP